MANKINYLDCNQSRFGTGILPCEIQTGVPIGFFPAKKTWRFDPATEVFDAAYIDEQIKNKNLVPFLNAIGFEAQNEEAEIFTSNLKIKLKVMDGLPGLSFDFSKGRGFHRAAYSFNSFGQYDYILAYSNGVIDLAITPEGTLKGYEGGMLDTGMFQNFNGSDPQKTTIMFQLTNSYEYNTQYALLEAAANGFSLTAVNGVVDALITKVSNTLADVVITVNATNNPGIALTGLAVADFLVEGTSETIDTVVYNSALKQYTLTFSGTVAADYAALKLFLYDTVDSTYVIKKGVTLWQGSSK